MLRELVSKCNSKHPLEKPLRIRSTILRKHVATVAQILVMNESDLGDLSNHMGHSNAVHKRFYKQSESMVGKTKIAKMLEVINQGTIGKYKGKKLEDVTLKDVINIATSNINIDEQEQDVDGDVDDYEDDSDANEIEENNTITTSISVASTEEDALPPTSKDALPSTSKSNPPIRAKHVSTKSTDSKHTRQHWPKWIKKAMKEELGDCQDHWSRFTEERARSFLARHNMEDREPIHLKNVLYNLFRGPRKK